MRPVPVSREPRGESGRNPYANPAARKALERRDANEQTYYRIDDAVFTANSSSWPR